MLGLSIDYRDLTTDPPTHLHLADSDAELRRFTTRALAEPLPMSFEVALRGGNVELERRVLKSSVFAGFLSSAAEAVVGTEDKHDYVQRAMLDQLTAEGQLRLHPQPLGRAQLAVDGLELAVFRGLAKRGGIELADGLYDMRLTADLRGLDGVDLKSRHVLTWLSLSEPPDGPISTYLRLPAPLQPVIFLLRNNNDELRLPVDLHVPADGVSSSAIANLAIESLTRILTDAVASAGPRALAAASGGLLAGGGDNEVPQIPATVTFAPGSPLPLDCALADIVDAARDDPTLSIVLTHELGPADLAHAERLATPPPAAVAATVARLQQTRIELSNRREPLVRDVVALYRASKTQEALQRQRELLALDTRLGELEGALREALDMLGDDNPRKHKRRTRATAIALSQARLDAVVEHILAAFPDLPRSRIDVRPGRGVPVDGVEGAGRVGAVLRRRSAEDVDGR